MSSLSFTYAINDITLYLASSEIDPLSHEYLHKFTFSRGIFNATFIFFHHVP